MWLIFLKFVLRSLLLILALSSEDQLRAHVIKTRLGLLEGVTKIARNQTPFHAYYGIPYAKAPLGNLRFEPPVEAGAWSGILNATQETERCPQLPNGDSGSDEYAGNEDCLFLHIYTPTNSKAGSNIPVIVYLFGGVFKRGSPLNEGPEFIMNRNIVLVMVSYRVGVLGFLSTGDTIIPGNMALKDQTLALKWTRENIYGFGGDPHKITLQGHSTGAACVHLHTLSPLSKEYFDQAIIQSGLGINPQSFWDRDIAKSIAHALAKVVNCPTDLSHAFKKCLKRIEIQELILASSKLQIWHMEPLATFRPVIEDKKVKNAFLNENPLLASYQSNTKPWLIGITSDEGAWYVGSYYNLGSSVLNINPKLLLPVIGLFKWTSKPNHINFIEQFAKTYFFGNENVSDTTNITDIALVKMLNGIMHGYGLIDVIQKYKAVKYAYLYDYRCIGGFTNAHGGRGGRYLGVAHADELALMFKEPNKTGITAEDLAFGDEMISRWINFAYSGNPNVPFPINTNVFDSWSPVSTSRIEFLRIKKHGSMEKDYFLKEYSFWKKLPYFSNYL